MAYCRWGVDCWCLRGAITELTSFCCDGKGASFAADRIALVHGGRYFRPGCIASADGPEGGNGRTRTWYLTDWVDGRYEAHGFGRLWKLEIDLDKADWAGTLDPEPISDKRATGVSI